MRRKEIEPERRYEHSDRKIDRDDDAEVNLIDARLRDERNEQWRKDQDRSRRFEHCADEQQHNVDDEEQQPSLKMIAHNELDELRRKSASRDEPRVSAGGGDEDENLGNGLGRIDDFPVQLIGISPERCGQAGQK
jgi:hypothetical protein